MANKTLPTRPADEARIVLSNIDTPAFRPALVRRRLATAAATLGALALSASYDVAHAAAGAGNTLGGRMQAVSEDLTTGGGYLLTVFGFILGGFALIAGGWAIYQHTKNPNGQSRMGYGIAGVLAGGFFLTLASIATFSAQTISGAAASSDGTSKQMMFN